VVFDLKFQYIAHHTLDLLDAGIAKLNHLSAVDANDVVMLFVAV
jgi:hypothetical protein